MPPPPLPSLPGLVLPAVLATLALALLVSLRLLLFSCKFPPFAEPAARTVWSSLDIKFGLAMHLSFYVNIG
jgi:hypothetical protein